MAGLLYLVMHRLVDPKECHSPIKPEISYALEMLTVCHRRSEVEDVDEVKIDDWTGLFTSTCPFHLLSRAQLSSSTRPNLVSCLCLIFT